MSINEVYRLVQFVYNKEQSGNITPDQFNLIAERGQISLINNRISHGYDQRGNKTGWQSNQSIRRELVTILKPNESISVAGGIAPFPSDYIDYDSLTTNGGILIREATTDEIAILNQSLIAPPTVNYPRFVQAQTGFHIYPNTLNPIKLSYLRRPLTPVWNYNTINGKPVYTESGGEIGGGNSVNFELPDIVHLEIIMFLLQLIGINLSLPEVTQYAMVKEKEGA